MSRDSIAAVDARATELLAILRLSGFRWRSTEEAGADMGMSSAEAFPCLVALERAEVIESRPRAQGIEWRAAGTQGT